MQWGKLWEAVAMGAAASVSDTIENLQVSRLVFGIRASSGGPSVAELKAAKLLITFVNRGVDTELVNATLYDLAMLTDMLGGYGRDWKDTDLTDVNIVIPLGLDMRNGGSLKVELLAPAAIANTTTTCYYVNDGTMPTTLKYSTLTTSGTAAYKSALQIFSRNETGDFCELEIENEAKKSMPYILGRILFAEEAKIEAETAYAKIFSSASPANLKIRASQGAATFFAIELP